MTRRYGDLILVAQHHDNQPRCFIWHGTTYRVQSVLAMWHLQDRWWEPIPSGQASSHEALEATASDRHYYRLECLPGLVCEIYFDSASDRWVLDRVYD